MVEKKFIDRLFDVRGKVALPTGATGALGKAIAFGYGHAGMKVFVTGRGEDKAKPFARSFRQQGSNSAIQQETRQYRNT